MRTTVTIEPDLYAKLKRLSGKQSFKELINDVLRRGLEALETLQEKRLEANFELPVFDVRPLIFDVDNVHRLLADLDR